MKPKVLRAGVPFGPYVIVSRLGRGAMAEVYLAKEPSGRKVALKILHRRAAGAAAGESPEGRFARESEVILKMAHPNIVTVYQVGTFHRAPFIAMEYVEGRTLRDVLAEGPLALADALDIAHQIAEGIASAHHAGIVHRDLKPENVMLTPANEVKILDFGLSKPLSSPGSTDSSETAEELTLPGTILGTVEYMSPEQASGYRADFAADQFALGVILYEMATGVVAFRRDTMARTLAAVIEGKPNPSESFETLPGAVRAVIERALTKTPAERFASMRELAFALDHAARSGARPVSKTRWAALGALLTVALCAAIYL